MDATVLFKMLSENPDMAAQIFMAIDRMAQQSGSGSTFGQAWQDTLNNTRPEDMANIMTGNHYEYEYETDANGNKVIKRDANGNPIYRRIGDSTPANSTDPYGGWQNTLKGYKGKVGDRLGWWTANNIIPGIGQLMKQGGGAAGDVGNIFGNALASVRTPTIQRSMSPDANINVSSFMPVIGAVANSTGAIGKHALTGFGDVLEDSALRVADRSEKAKESTLMTNTNPNGDFWRYINGRESRADRNRRSN